ncbi:MAG: hypothetical protein HONDAALG_04341 [Gammaproteobacteria bacterium]|nr:hypothetical protein [Gammaproteobacteria bacterium]
MEICRIAFHQTLTVVGYARQWKQELLEQQRRCRRVTEKQQENDRRRQRPDEAFGHATQPGQAADASGGITLGIMTLL